MRKQVFHVTLPICVFVLIGSARPASAGDLALPPGEIRPTMKTLCEVDARIPVQSLPGSETALHVISEPGSYYLTGNINGEAGKHGIEIVGISNVTVDLNGFALIGTEGSLDGINARGPTPAYNITVRNGAVRDWGATGVNFGGGGIDNVLVSDLTVSHNGVDGIFGVRGVITRCAAYANGRTGIQGNVIRTCTAYLNGGVGINSSGGVVRDCKSYRNDGVGIVAGHIVIACVSDYNTGGGISAPGRNAVINCAAVHNTNFGIRLAGGSSAINCTANDNEVGPEDPGVGIIAVQQNVVEGCTANLNEGDGIQVGNLCRVVGNHCYGNISGVGIHSTGQGTHIEGNTVTYQAAGILVDDGALYNVIIKNIAIGSGGQYVIQGSDHLVGDILSGGEAFSSTNAWANLDR